MGLVEQKEAEAYEIFKTLRNRLRKFRPEEVVHYCIRQLNPGRSFEWEEVRHRPLWLLFLLIKWIAVNGDFLSPTRRALSERDTKEFIATLIELQGKDLPTCYENGYLFFRAHFNSSIGGRSCFLSRSCRGSTSSSLT